MTYPAAAMRPDEFVNGLWTGYNRWAAFTLWYALEENVIEGWQQQRDEAWEYQNRTGRSDMWDEIKDRWATQLGVDQAKAEKWWGIVPYVIGGLLAQTVTS